MTAIEAYEQRDSIGRRTIKKHELSAAEIEEILQCVRDDKLAHREAAVKFGVSPRLVSSLVSAQKRDGAFLDTLRGREQKRRQKLGAVLDASIR